MATRSEEGEKKKREKWQGRLQQQQQQLVLHDPYLSPIFSFSKRKGYIHTA
jgi:hypothetical protein